MTTTAVVHLVWGPLGVEPLRDFLRSYREHDAGAEHELVIVFNGVPRAAGAPSPRMHRSARAKYAGVTVPEREAFLAELRDIPHRLVELERPVQDLPAYAMVAERLQHDRLCFLNSHSTILAPLWLAKLGDGLAQPGAGLVAATGSWASLSSWVLYTLMLPSPYRGILPGRHATKEQFLAIDAERDNQSAGASGEPTPQRRSTLDRLKELPAIPEQLIRFRRFPAAHLRTNGFMVERELLRNLRMARITRKMDAYSLESGRNNITRQIRRQGLQALVVARDGETYTCERWPESRTFWQRQQEGLLIADNQTRFYANGSPARQRVLAAFAWGRQGDPGSSIALAGA
jgi:hypothetical protein